MSSTNPAFVKAFARHRVSSGAAQGSSRVASNGGGQTQTVETRPTPEQAGDLRPKPGNVPATPVSPNDQSSLADQQLVEQLGELHLDASVASTASMWLDTNSEQIARADQAIANPPTPHVEPARAPVDNVTKEVPAESPPLVPNTQLTDTTQAVEVDSSDDASIVESLQHIHTAYAVAPVEFGVGISETTQPEVVDLSKIPSTPSLPSSESATVEEASVGIDTASQVTETPDVAEMRVDSPEVNPPKSHSHTSSSTTAPLVPFQAVWEVDVFDIPRVVADLFFDGVLFQQIAERMGEAVGSGLNSVLVSSTKTGEGRSSVAIGMAMAAAAAGIRVALVDADTEKPSLADDLRLDLQFGWVDTIRGGLPIAEVAVHAIEDGVTLIPLMTPHGTTAATSSEVVQLLNVLRNRFELVIIDGPASMDHNIEQCAKAIDTAIIVRDVNRTDAEEINAYSYRLREAGIQGIGVVENFA